MLSDCKYDKVKLLHELSSIAWYIEKHAETNAKKMGDEQCALALENIKKDLEKHIENLKGMLN